MKEKRQLYHSKSITSSKDNKRQLFSKINTLLGKEGKVLPDNDDDLKTANEFSNFFKSKVSIIHDDITLKLADRDNSVFNNDFCSSCVFSETPFSTFNSLNNR